MIGQLEEVSGRLVSRETFDRIQHFVDLLREEAQQQNLIAPSTIGPVWDRHILDSAQLVRFEPHPGASWADIGAGAGLPGVVIALLAAGPVLLIEPRRLRAEFLEKVVTELRLRDRVNVAACKVEKVTGQFDVITARAVAALDKLLRISTHLSTRKTVWALPKGQGAQSELADAKRSWHCDAKSVPSRTDPTSKILVLQEVKARSRR